MEIEWIVATVTIVAGIVTIVWFIRDVGRENVKILMDISEILRSIREDQKSIIDVQRLALETYKAKMKY